MRVCYDDALPLFYDAAMPQDDADATPLYLLLRRLTFLDDIYIVYHLFIYAAFYFCFDIRYFIAAY